ncbi:MAG: hypothetical protein H7Y08_09475 [Rhizobiaceae bacterium]|nr:hypothetical protein [Rhizobiaceae bacterium]
MGFVAIASEELADDAGGRARDEGPVRISTVPRHQSCTVSTIVTAADGTLVYGPERPVDVANTTRTLIRQGGDRNRLCDFIRFEFRIALGEARAAGLDDTASIVAAEMPLAQRRVHLLRLQTYSTRLDPVVFEAMDELPAPFATIEERRAASDGAAIRAVHGLLRRDPFTSEHRWTAALTGIGPSPFRSYEDEGSEKPNHRKDESFAIAAVGKTEAVRNSLFLDKRLGEAHDLTGRGFLRLRHNKQATLIPIPAEVSDKAPIHLNLAIDQAMAGAGKGAKSRIGKPVALYALELFEAHMLNALRRREGELPTYVGVPDWLAERYAANDPLDGDGADGSEDDDAG